MRVCGNFIIRLFTIYSVFFVEIKAGVDEAMTKLAGIPKALLPGKVTFCCHLFVC